VSDVFLSYASKDRPTAERLAEALQSRGWSVWWDRQVPTGQPFDGAIENALGQARCVIVLWSAASILSDWVKVEASDGRARRMLLPVLIEDVSPPLEFRRLQAIRLLDWQGTSDHPRLDQLMRDVARMLDQPAPPPAPPPPPRRGWLALMILPTVIALLLPWVLMSWRVPTPIRLQIAVSRVEFTLAATEAPLTRISDAVPFGAISVERFAAVTVEPAAIQIADPAQYSLAQDRYPESAWREMAISGGVVRFHPMDDMRLPSVTIEPAAADGTGLSTLRPISVPAASRVTLESAGDLGRTLTLKLAHRDPLLALPFPGRFQLTAAQTIVSGLPERSAPGRHVLTFRVELREGSRPVEILGNADSLVISVRVSPVPADRPVVFFSDGAIPIAALDLTREDGLGNRVSAVVAESHLSYPDSPAAAPQPIPESDAIGLDRLRRFQVRRITLDPARRGMQLELEGIAGHVATSHGYVTKDHRLTALQVLKRRPGWLALALLAWMIPTTVGFYRFRRIGREARA
jgi:TIR domain